MIEIKNHCLVFKKDLRKKVNNDLINTNIISDNELSFSKDYLLSNNEIVSLFLNELYKENNIKEIVIENNSLALIVIDLLKYIKVIDELILLEDSVLSYTIANKIIESKNILKINSYSLPTFLIELFDKSNIKVVCRSEILFTSKFMQKNSLSSLSDLYYKKSIYLDINISKNELEDIDTFLNINKYLKTVHISKYSRENINSIINILNKLRKKNIIIEIHEDITDLKEIEFLKKLNRMLNNKIKIKLMYSKGYLEDNYLKQIIYTTLKYCSIIIFLIIIGILSYIFYNNYSSEKEVKIIKQDIKNLLLKDDNSKKYDFSNVTSYEKLLSLNSDSVGWLKINNTNIDYPVVQGTDNEYYLSRNYYKKRDYNGWVFMDYRNSNEELNDNTIIYAHNRYTSGVMFGTLNNIEKWKWYSNKENHIIIFNTLNKQMKWKIFSFYSLDVTNDYLFINFENKEKYQKFIDKITERSNYNFGTTVTSDDKILTLSTCLDGGKRFVVHAVLQND